MNRNPIKITAWGLVALFGGVVCGSSSALAGPAPGAASRSPAAPGTVSRSPGAPGAVSQASSLAEMLEKAIYAEETVGNIDEAIEIYQKLVQQATTDREYAAQAQYRLGICYLKKKQNEQAAAAFRQLIMMYPEQKELADLAKSQLASIDKMPAPPVIQKRIDRAVTDFPPTTDLSSPESAAAAWQRAYAAGDAKAITEISWTKIDQRELEITWKKEQEHSPDRWNAFRKATENSTVLEVLTYKDDLAVAITLLPLEEETGRDPYSGRFFGRIDGQWKNLGEDRYSSELKAKRTFELKKDRLWNYFAWIRESLGLKDTEPAALGPADAAVLFLASVSAGHDWRDLRTPPEQLKTVYANDEVGLAITSEAEWPDGRRAPCLFYLAKKDGVWKFDRGGIGKADSARAVQMKTEMFLKQYPDAREVPSSTRPVVRKTRPRHFVRLVIGVDRMTFEGEDTTDEKLPELLNSVPDRKHTVLEVAISGNVLANRVMTALSQANAHEFEYGSYIGEAEFGTKGSHSQDVSIEDGAAVVSKGAMAVTESFLSAMRDNDAERTMKLLSGDFGGSRNELRQIPALMDFSKTELVKAHADVDTVRAAYWPVIIKGNGARFFIGFKLVRSGSGADSWLMQDAFFMEDEDPEDLKSATLFVDGKS